jgi:hypothetical protein
VGLNIDPQIIAALIGFIGAIAGSLLGAWAVTQPHRFSRVVSAGVVVICVMLTIVIGLSVLPKLFTPVPLAQPPAAILTAQQVLDLLVPDSAERALATAHSENNGIINWVVDTKNGGAHGREITFSHPGYGGFDYWGGYKPTNDSSCTPRLDTDPISNMPEWYVVCTQHTNMPSKMDGVTWWPHGK